jgi:hypothetical protein
MGARACQGNGGAEVHQEAAVTLVVVHSAKTVASVTVAHEGIGTFLHHRLRLKQAVDTSDLCLLRASPLMLWLVGVAGVTVRAAVVAVAPMVRVLDV